MLALAGCIIAAIHVIYRFRQTGVLYIIYLLSFTEGLVEMAGIQPILSRAVEALLILALFTVALYSKTLKKEHFQTCGLGFMAGILAIAGVSALYNGTSLVGFAVFANMVFLPYLLLLAILNASFSCDKVSHLVYLLVLLQLPAVLIKLIVIGQSESGGIGTVSLADGTVSTVFPSLICCFLFAYFLYREKWSYLWLVGGFCAFGLIGKKKAIIAFVPIALVTVYTIYLLNAYGVQLQKRLKVFGLLAICVCSCVYATVRLVPEFNVDGRVGGAFDLGYAIEFAADYEARKPGMRDTGRLSAMVQVSNRMCKSGIHNYIGYGPGETIKTRFLPGHDNDLNWNKFRLGYGGKTALMSLWLQVGLVGVSLYLLYMLHLFLTVCKCYLRHGTYREHIPTAVGVLGGVSVFMLDFLLYSDASMQYSFIWGVLFYAAGLVLRNVKCSARFRSCPMKVPM